MKTESDIFRNRGMLVELADGRKCIVYHNQPLIKDHGKMLLHLIDDDHNLLKDNHGEPRRIMKNVADYDAMMKEAKLIGYTD